MAVYLSFQIAPNVCGHPKPAGMCWPCFPVYEILPSAVTHSQDSPLLNFIPCWWKTNFLLHPSFKSLPSTKRAASAYLLSPPFSVSGELPSTKRIYIFKDVSATSWVSLKYAKKVNRELKSFLIKLIAIRQRSKVGKNSNELRFVTSWLRQSFLRVEVQKGAGELMG